MYVPISRNFLTSHRLSMIMLYCTSWPYHLGVGQLFMYAGLPKGFLYNILKIMIKPRFYSTTIAPIIRRNFQTFIIYVCTHISTMNNPRNGNKSFYVIIFDSFWMGVHWPPLSTNVVMVTLIKFSLAFCSMKTCVWCFILDAWCLLLDAWCIRPEAQRLMLCSIPHG